MNTFGRNLSLSLFGESHGAGVGAVLSGLPAGFALDLEEIYRQMARRAPGGTPWSTARSEPDAVEITSGLLAGKLTGAPLSCFIRNLDARPSDYPQGTARPGHADLAAHLKYGGHADSRGGGQFSGRLTAPIVFAGAVCRQILKEHGITIGAHIAEIWKFQDKPFAVITAELLDELGRSPFPVLDPRIGKTMEDTIGVAKSQGDSVGGAVECAAIGVPPGLGGPYFDNLEGQIAAMLYAIPGVKAVEFGAGTKIAAMTGREANDPIRRGKDGTYYTTSNHAGGINGGISNGMPIVCRVAFRPTPSIALPQESVCLISGQNQTIQLTGRHDPCIVPRALPVVEAGVAICLLDNILKGN
ncbi:MAG: chorismate synthase [Oscillospiraceae bacterium]|nr:chorismate synthase [Oscillospiraceae bacterium]